MCFHLFVNPYCRSNSVALQPSNISHRNYRVRRESCRLKTLRKFLKMREINEGNPIPPKHGTFGKKIPPQHGTLGEKIQSLRLDVLDNSYKSSNHFHTGITSIFLSFTTISSSNS